MQAGRKRGWQLAACLGGSQLRGGGSLLAPPAGRESPAAHQYKIPQDFCYYNESSLTFSRSTSSTSLSAAAYLLPTPAAPGCAPCTAQ